MTTVSLFFLTIFIIVQGLLGVAVLYRGIALIFDGSFLETWKRSYAAFSERMSLWAEMITWRRIMIFCFLFVPGSLVVFAAVMAWRAIRRPQANVARIFSPQWLKTEIQNIAL